MTHEVIPIPHPGLPALSAAMNLKGPKGMCFHRAVALCLDLSGSTLVVATLRAATEEEQVDHPERSSVPFIHAWVEFNDKLLAPSTIESMGGLVFIRPEEYYQVNGAKDIRRLTRNAIRKHVADKHVLRQLLEGIDPPRRGWLVGRLLDAAGVKYLITPGGGIIPVPEKQEGLVQ
jgi:hypothetical protein